MVRIMEEKNRKNFINKMAQNSLLEKIEQLKNSQKVKQTTPEQQQLAQQAYARTQPLY